MLEQKDKIAIWMESSVDDDYGKMAFRIYKETNVGTKNVFESDDLFEGKLD